MRYWNRFQPLLLHLYRFREVFSSHPRLKLLPRLVLRPHSYSGGLALNPNHCAQTMATSRKIALLFGAENINAIIGWIALLFVARKLGAAALGEFSYAMSLVGGFTFLAFFGFRMAHIKRISEGLDLGKCIGTFLSIRLF